MTVKNFKVKNGLTVGTGATIYENGNIDVAGIITAATFKGDGSGLINVTALGTGIQINNNGSVIGIGSIVDFGENISVSPVFAGITTITGSTNPIPGISTIGSSFFNELQVGAAATFSGEVEVADYIRHKGDTNTAIRFPTDDTFSVVTGSLERFRVESDGEIGIGTASPRAKLDVDGTIYSAGNIKLYDNVKAQFGDGQDLSIYWTGSRAKINSSGSNLDIESDYIALKNQANSKEYLNCTNGGAVKIYFDHVKRLETTGTGVNITDDLNVAGVSTFHGEIHALDNVGIGTNNPSSDYRVTIKSSTSPHSALLLDTTESDYNTNLYFAKQGTNKWIIGNKATDDAFRIVSGSTERLRISSDGNVGIATTNATNTLTMQGQGSYGGDTITSNDYPCLNISNTQLTYDDGDIFGGITFTKRSGNDNGISAGILALFGDSGGSAKPPTDLVFFTSKVTAPTGVERMRITDSGDVSIGSSITVGGISKFNGNVGISSALLDKDGDKGNSGQVLSSTGTQVDWINVGSIAAGAASSIAISANNTTNETVYPIFTDGSTGNRGAEVDTGLTYNPSTGVLTATELSGNASTATSLANARNIGGVSFNGTANIDLPGVNAAGNQNTSGTAAGLSGTPDITVDEIGTRNINVSGVTTTAAVNWGGHMLPTSNGSYDIGSADLKVRHLFLSDNSLKFVDAADVEHPLSLDSGRLKFGGGLLLGTTIKADTVSGIVTATTFSGALSGNAATASKLATSRQIGGVAFDGTANITPNVAGGLTGTPNITVGVLNASSGTVSGNLDVQGTLTYVNVDNVTSIGIGTFKKGIQIHGDGLDVVGIATFGTGIGVTGNITVTGNVDGRDISADGTKLDTIATSANNYTHPNHSGEVTSTADGATVIASNIVDEDNLKISNTGTNGQYLSKQSGNTGGLTWATVDLTDTKNDELYQWTLGASGGSDYTFSGPGLTGTVNDPELHLIRGQTYKFINNSSGHPFRIQSTTATSGGGTQYNTGVTNNDATGNTSTNVLTFEVPQDAPNRLYYQCTSHPSMFGTLNISSATPEITWTLGAPSSSHYTFSGSGFSAATNDPTLYLIRGQTYKFNNQSGGHPFRIQSTTATSGGGTQYNTGVTNNDATGGTATNVLTFVVPMDAPNKLYYQCTSHPAMFGAIKIGAVGTISGEALVLGRVDSNLEGGEIQFKRSSDDSVQWTNDVYGNDATAILRWHHGGNVLAQLSTAGAFLCTNSSTANSFIKSGGTAAQFLKADGSTSTLTFSTGLTNTSGTVTADAAVKSTVTGASNSTASFTMDTVALADFHVLEYIIYLSHSTAGTQAQKLLIMCNGTDHHHTEYGVMYSSSLLGTFSTATSGSDLQVRFTPVNSATSIEYTKQVIEA